MLFYNAEAYRFAFVSACLLVGQFTVVWVRVLPYLHDTYGATSTECEWTASPCLPPKISVVRLDEFVCTCDLV